MAFHPKSCPHCYVTLKFQNNGFFRIKRSGQRIKRFRCGACKKSFSSRTLKPGYYQKKPHLNTPLHNLICEGVSLRAASRLLGLTYRNTYLKFLWLSRNRAFRHQKIQSKELYFDEMETIEHTKCKPLSVALVVNENYQILGARVAKMPCKGKLARFSRKKYGFRPDERERARNALFESLAKSHTNTVEKVLSDANPSYKKLVRKYFPKAFYEVHSRANKERARDRLHEIFQKKTFDPLFPLNQRCAKLRSDIKRLTRRSWCTTKKPENLQRHLDLYIALQS
jgi:transposase-like protein